MSDYHSNTGLFAPQPAKVAHAHTVPMPPTVPVDALLRLEGVHTHIGAYHILHGVDLVVPRGQLTMLLGRNGAGKTTTLRTIMGLWQASQGRVVFNGQDITRHHTPQIAGLNIAYVPENMGIFADLTVKENMLLAARAAKRANQMDEARLQWIFKLFPAVEKFWNHPAGKLSGGQKQMLAVARAIVEELAGKPAPEPLWENTCYALAGKDYGLFVADVFKIQADGKIGRINGKGRYLPLNATPAQIKLGARYQQAWLRTFTADCFA